MSALVEKKLRQDFQGERMEKERVVEIHRYEGKRKRKYIVQAKLKKKKKEDKPFRQSP